MDEIQRQFAGWLEQTGLHLSEDQANRFELYYQQLVDWNQRMNLTAITEREQVYAKHFFDSLSLSKFIFMKDIETLADIGSGAGFPSIPLKIMFPHLRVTIIDSLKKRIHFLEHLIEQLNLTGVDCIHGRAEELGRNKKLRDHYDLVTARAVARLNVLNEFCLPFVRINGQFAAMKGSQYEEELQQAGKSIRLLKAELVDVHSLQLPEEEGLRHIIILRKKDQTPAPYPRRPGIPLKQPLE